MDQQAIDPSSGKQSNETRPEREHLTDLDQIVRRHLHDENDRITEEDIRDAVIGFPSESDNPTAGQYSHNQDFTTLNT